MVADYLWYRRKVPGAYPDSLGFDVIDKWGRVIPDPVRWPSSKGGKGFTEVAKKVHSLGLKFGIHVMRGISTQAVNANTPILDPAKVLLLNPIIATKFSCLYTKCTIAHISLCSFSDIRERFILCRLYFIKNHKEALLNLFVHNKK